MKADLTQEVKMIALSEGACIFGVAPVAEPSLQSVL